PLRAFVRTATRRLRSARAMSTPVTIACTRNANCSGGRWGIAEVIDYRDRVMFLHGVAFASALLGCEQCAEQAVNEVAAALFVSTRRADGRAISDAFLGVLREGGFNQDLRRDN